MSLPSPRVLPGSPMVNPDRPVSTSLDPLIEELKEEAPGLSSQADSFQDAWQDAVLGILTRRESERPLPEKIQAAKAYFWRAFLNARVSAARRSAQNPETGRPFELAATSVGDSVVSAMLAAEVRQIVREAVRQLDTPERVAVEQIYFEGQTFKATARSIAALSYPCTVDRVKGLIKNAKKRLAFSLRGLWNAWE